MGQESLSLPSFSLVWLHSLTPDTCTLRGWARKSKIPKPLQFCWHRGDWNTALMGKWSVRLQQHSHFPGPCLCFLLSCSCFPTIPTFYIFYDFSELYMPLSDEFSHESSLLFLVWFSSLQTQMSWTVRHVAFHTWLYSWMPYTISRKQISPIYRHSSECHKKSPERTYNTLETCKKTRYFF